MKIGYSFLLFMLLCSGLQAQKPLDGLWLLNDEKGMEFGPGDKIACRDFSFFDRYTLQGDTLTIVHDYTDHECYRMDSLGNRVECEGWKLSDATFLTHQHSDTELWLYPLNPSAMKIAGDLNRPFLTFELKHYEELAKRNQREQQVDTARYPYRYRTSIMEPSIETIKLTASLTRFAPMKFDSISISYFQQGWMAQYYYDLKLYSDGSFIVHHKRDGLDKGEFKDRKAVLGWFRDQLSKEEMGHISRRLSESGIAKMKSGNFVVSTIHGKEISLKVYSGDTCKTLKGVKGELPLLIESLVDQLLEIDNFKDYKPTSDRTEFETTFVR